MTKIDKTADTVTVDNGGLVRVDQIAVFALTMCDGQLWAVVRDRNRQRSCARGDNQVRVPVNALVEKVTREYKKTGGKK